MPSSAGQLESLPILSPFASLQKRFKDNWCDDLADSMLPLSGQNETQDTAGLSAHTQSWDLSFSHDLNIGKDKRSTLASGSLTESIATSSDGSSPASSKEWRPLGQRYGNAASIQCCPQNECCTECRQGNMRRSRLNQLDENIDTDVCKIVKSSLLSDTFCSPDKSNQDDGDHQWRTELQHGLEDDDVSAHYHRSSHSEALEAPVSILKTSSCFSAENTLLENQCYKWVDEERSYDKDCKLDKKMHCASNRPYLASLSTSRAKTFSSDSAQSLLLRQRSKSLACADILSGSTQSPLLDSADEGADSIWSSNYAEQYQSSQLRQESQSRLWTQNINLSAPQPPLPPSSPAGFAKYSTYHHKRDTRLRRFSVDANNTRMQYASSQYTPQYPKDTPYIQHERAASGSRICLNHPCLYDQPKEQDRLNKRSYVAFDKFSDLSVANQSTMLHSDGSDAYNLLHHTLPVLLRNPRDYADRVANHPKYDTFYQVEFKRGRRQFYTGADYIPIDTYVRVEADRGEDVGKIIQVETAASGVGNDSVASIAASNMGEFGYKRILRAATPREFDMLLQQRREEKEVYEVCKGKAQQRLLPMEIIDAEYQFDRHKLTFYFQADRRIDFRELVRDLFAIYKTRIWLQQVMPDRAKVTS